MDKKQNYHIKHREIVPEYYSSNKYIKRLFFDRFRIALSYLKKTNAKRVLDAGCGDGLFTNAIKRVESVADITGVDLNVHTEQLNDKYEGIKFIRSSLTDLSFRKKFDAITCLAVLEHFKNVEEILKILKSNLKEDGYFIVSGPVEDFWYKLGRLITKGTFSQETGPGAGTHYYNIIQLDKIIQRHFKLIKTKKIKFLFIHLFSVNLYKNTLS
jgi:2-polyprenyl-3-methyl-5-hydroxy-6-metoxy-1,4-benzoquinol methylase